MISDTLPDPFGELERYLVPDYADLDALTPSVPELKPFEIEMRIRLDDGDEVAVVEQADSISDLGGALERARVRLAMSLARSMI
jgi:hypothetical protein